MSSMEEVLSKQQRMVKAATAMKELKDPKEILDAAARLQEMGKELEKSAKNLEARYAPISGPEERVVLTPDQRQRIASETGVALEMLTVRDDKNATFRRAMPSNDRATIERMAARQAAEIAIKKAKEEAVQKLIKELEKLGVPELEPVIEAIRKDPTLKLLMEQQEEAAAEAKVKAEVLQQQLKQP